MSDGPVLKQTIRYVGNDLLTRERPISAQMEEPALRCSNSFSVKEAKKVHVGYFMKHEVLMRKWQPPDATV